jgi:Flp pilus assembly protein TadG
VRRAGEEGMVAAFAAVVAVSLVMVAGMVLDGGRVVAAQATARDLASAAARAGAQELDLELVRGDGAPVLDPGRAEAAALAFLDASGVAGTVAVEGPAVTVVVTLRQPMAILPVADRTVRVSHTATALDRPEVRS